MQFFPSKTPSAGMRSGGPFGFNISGPVSRKHHRARLGELHVGAALVQGEPAVGDGPLMPPCIRQACPLSLYKNGSLIFSISMRPLNTVLRIKRTLDGAEIDKIISDVETSKALAMERRRRADWRKRELAASRFRAECDHCHGLNQIGCGSW
jgi:hypothetical protein